MYASTKPFPKIKVSPQPRVPYYNTILMRYLLQIFARIVRFVRFLQEVLMNTRQKLHQIKLQEWLEHFQNQTASGLTVK